MNYTEACANLDICATDKIDIHIIKRKYKIKALIYHPDKNKSPDANNKFIEMHESYEYLMKHEGFIGDLNFEKNSNMGDTNVSFSKMKSYSDLLKSFIFSLSTGDMNISSFHTILQNISNMCETKALALCEKLDKNILIKVYEMLFKHKHIFHISNDFLTNISNVIKTKTINDECIILNPSLSDLYNNNLYKLIVNSQTYIIPLWHHELVYDNSGNEIIIKCYPIMPDNMEIDAHNNIHILVRYPIQALLETDIIQVQCHTRSLPIYTNTLNIKKSQQIIFAKQGVSKLNTANIYDITNVSDVIITIETYS